MNHVYFDRGGYFNFIAARGVYSKQICTIRALPRPVAPEFGTRSVHYTILIIDCGILF